MNNYIGIATIICIIALATASCKKFVTVDPPNSELTTETVFSDSVNARRAVTGIYINMMEAFGLSFGSGAVTLYAGLSADELKAAPDNIKAYEFFNNKVNPLNEGNYALWWRAYGLIYKVNACIEGITNSANISEHAKNDLIAESKTLRAFFYFNLTNLYGNVPLLTTTDYNVNRLASRSEPSAVYAQMEEDLLFTKSHLKGVAIEQGRVSYYAATALLAKVYLYQQKYEQAKREAGEIIESGLFQLETTPADVFVAGSKETIWALIPVFPGRETWEAYSFVPGGTDVVPTYPVSDTLYSAFATGDLRKEQWIGVNMVEGLSYPFPYKYKNRDAGSGGPEYYTVFRLAEQYLVRAEAMAQMGDLAAAMADVNQLRRRAGLGDLITGDKTTVLNTIAKERQTELFCEWGNRWYDLKRTGRADELLSKIKQGWTGVAKLYPIPQRELTANPNLVQNAGY